MVAYPKWCLHRSMPCGAERGGVGLGQRNRALAVARERLHDEAKRLHVDEPPSLDLVGEHVK